MALFPRINYRLLANEKTDGDYNVEGLLYQDFVVVDKAVFIEVSNVTYLNALLTLMGVYFTFNLSYDKRQELVFQFNEKFLLGLHPAKKSVRYHTMHVAVTR